MTMQSTLKNYTDCGIYTITHTASGKVYVGSSKCIIKRKSRHLTSLLKNKHPNDYLQAAYNKYGAEAFAFKAVLACCPEDRIFHEQRLINQYRSSERIFGYNGSSIAGMTEITTDTREKMRKARIGKAPWNKGVSHTKEAKQRMSESHKGQVAWNRGKPWSDEVKKKLSNIRVGTILSEETKKKISESHKGKNTWSKGRILSQEHKRKLSASGIQTHCNRGHILSENNLYYESGRKRRCKVCVLNRQKKYKLDKKMSGGAD